MVGALLIASLVGWLLGSIPVAYLVVRWTRGIDLTRAGSANVGANNAFRTTGSQGVGVAVLILDAAKGAIAAAAGASVAWLVAPDAAPEAARYCSGAALLCAIAGHNYNLPLSIARRQLAGGKGLATAAGGFLGVTPLLVPIWVALCAAGVLTFAALRGVRDVIPGNVLATALIPLFGWLLYGAQGLFLVTVFCLLVLPKHAAQTIALLDPKAGRSETGDARPAKRSSGLQETVKPADTTR